MTDTMLEKVARAMRQRYAEHAGDKDIVPWEKAKSREAWLVCARAALEAIRTPGNTVMEAGSAAARKALAMQQPYVAVAGWIYRAMIDAILSENPPEQPNG